MFSFAKAVINASSVAWELGAGQGMWGELKTGCIGLDGYQQLVSWDNSSQESGSAGQLERLFLVFPPVPYQTFLLISLQIGNETLHLHGLSQWPMFHSTFPNSVLIQTPVAEQLSLCIICPSPGPFFQLCWWLLQKSTRSQIKFQNRFDQPETKYLCTTNALNPIRFVVTEY